MSGGTRGKAQPGFSLLELAVVVAVFGILAAALLNRLSYYQEAAEKAQVDYTVGAMKNALRHRMAELIIAGRAQEFHLLANDSPMDWLDQKPANYRGAIAEPQPDGIPPGSWYFDPARRELVYVPGNAAHFQPDVEGRKRIRLQAVLRRNFEPLAGESGDGAHSTDSVALEPVEPYFWL